MSSVAAVTMGLCDATTMVVVVVNVLQTAVDAPILLMTQTDIRITTTAITTIEAIATTTITTMKIITTTTKTTTTTMGTIATTIMRATGG